MMVQRHRYLDQSLQELLVRPGGGAPDVFERFVGLKKGGAVEQLDSLPILLEIHAILWHSAAEPGPRQILNFIVKAGRPIRFSISKREPKL